MDQQDKIVHAIKITEREELRIVLGKYKGRPFLDQRIYFKPTGSNEFKPTKEALRLRPDFCPELKIGMAKAESMLESAK
jgi:hypothetical protein